MISGSNEHLQQELEYTLLKPDCHSWWISNMQSGRKEERYVIKFCLKFGKISQKHMECFRLLLEYLAWIEHQFLSGIRDSSKAGSLWGMMRGVGGVRKSIHQSWVPTGQTVNNVYYIEVLREFRNRFRRKRPALFKSGHWYFYEDNAPVHNSILVTDYLTKMGIKTLPHHPCSPDLAPCDFCLFPKLKENRFSFFLFLLNFFPRYLFV